MNREFLADDLASKSATLFSESWREIRRLNLQVSLTREQILQSLDQVQHSLELLEELSGQQDLLYAERVNGLKQVPTQDG